jgi:hypothetical protein
MTLWALQEAREEVGRKGWRGRREDRGWEGGRGASEGDFSDGDDEPSKQIIPPRHDAVTVGRSNFSAKRRDAILPMPPG